MICCKFDYSICPFLFTESHAVFKILVYKTIKDLESKMPIECGNELKFINTDVNETRMPIFVIYSYNSNVEQVNYQVLAQRLAQRNHVYSEEESSTRKKRTASLAGCRVESLIVHGSEIVLDLLGIYSSASVQRPMSYNAGICGGTCSHNLPTGDFSKHAPFIHVLLTSVPSFKQRQEFSFTQCCAPVNYKPLDILYVANGEIVINTIQDMILDTCECIDVIRSS